MRKKFFIVISICLLLVSGAFLFGSYGENIYAQSNVTFESFSSSVLELLQGKNLEDDYDKTFYKNDDLTKIDNSLMVDSETFSEITKSNVKLNGNSCEISREDNTVLINANDNVMLVNNKDLIVTINEPKVRDNKIYFSLQDVAGYLGYEIIETQDKIILSNPYQTKRLIVNSSKSLDSMGAIKKAEGYKDLHIFEYSSEDACKKALNYYNSLSYVKWAEVSKVYSVKDLYSYGEDDNKEDSALLEKTTNTESENSPQYNNDTNSPINKSYKELNNVVAEKENNLLLNNKSTATAKASSSYTTWGASAMGVENYTNYLLNKSNINNVIVAVLDTGLDSNHSWFTNRIAIGGKNFSNSQSTTSYEYEDAEGHGTHVAGTVVDLTPSNVKILPIKVMDDDGYGTTENIWSGIEYVNRLKTGEETITSVSSDYFKNIVSMNLSLGGSSYNYNTYNTYLTNAYNNGILPVVAAGNDGADVKNTSPANVSCVITVSAVGKAGENSFFHPYWSNWGQYIDVCAPGEDIVSACVGGGTVSMDGTSMASPHVAGLVALLYSSGEYSLDKSGAEAVTDVIKSTCVDLGTAGWDNYFGEGLCYIGFAYAQILEDAVTFSDTQINHNSSFNLTLSHSNNNATIYYTTDGSEPTQESTEYQTSIAVSTSQIIKARAIVKQGSNITAYSKVSSNTYVINGLDIDNAYTISSSGELISYNGLLSNVSVPTSYKGTTITSVGERAFISANPTIVTLPESVTTINRYGFYGCSNLQKVVGSGVTTIGMYAFYFSENLQSVTDSEFPNLKTIDKYAFSNCASLQNVNLTNVTLVDYFAFCNNNVTSQSLTSINLPNVKTIGDCAFYGHNSLSSATLPKVEVIGTKTFLGCSLQNLNLPCVKYIGIQCFEDNKTLTNVDMPNLLLVGSQCFYNCTNLTTVNLPQVKHIASVSFTNSGITQIDLPQVESIGVEAFQNCTKLTTITAPKLKIIKAEAFYNCPSLEEINLPNIVSIEREAFYNITSVSSVTLSSCLEYISSVAFNRFNSNCVFYIYASTPAKQFVLEFKSSNGASVKYEELDEDLSIFTYEIVNNQVSITGVNTSGLTSLRIPSFISSLPVTKITSNAFSNCNLILALNLPNILVLESGAFSGCTNLVSLYAPNLKGIGANAFNGCSNLEDIEIPNAESIGNMAFYNCPKLTKVKLGENVISIGTRALGFVNGSVSSTFNLIGFDGVTKNYATENGITFHNVFSNLQRFYFNYYTNNGTTEISISLVDSYTEGGVIIPSTYSTGGKTYNITRIGDNAFENCVLITNVQLPSSIVTLGASAFYNCTNLKTINLNYVTTIGPQCFSRCENLQSVILDNIEEINAQTFAYCYNLKEVNLPQTTFIGDQAFYFCVGLESVISPNLQTISHGGFSNCYRLKNINLNTITTLGTNESGNTVNAKFTGSVFENCYELGEFAYLANIQNMGGHLFDGSSVTSVVIGKNFSFYSEYNNGIINYRPTDSSITIYGYSNTFANTYATRYKYTFIPLDNFKVLNNVEFNRTCFENEDCTLQINATGFNLQYQWYSYNGVSGTPIENTNSKTFSVDTTSTGTKRYYVEVTNWDGEVISSSTFTVTVLPSYEITVTYNKNRGIITSGGKVSAGSNATYTITAFDGCFVESIIVDGTALNNTQMQDAINNGYTFTNISSNHTLEVEFGIATYTITISYGANGSVFNEDNQQILSGSTIIVEHNSSLTLIFKGNTNYHAEHILLDNVDMGKQTSYTLTNIKANHTLQVEFEVNVYSITLSHNNFGEVKYTNSLDNIYDGENRVFTIEVEDGYYVESVVCNGVILPVSEDNTFTISNIHSDINLVVNFKKINEGLDIPKNTTEAIIFAGIIVAVLIVIFAPVLMFRKRKR